MYFFNVKFVFLFFLINNYEFTSVFGVDPQVPVVLWHGMGTSYKDMSGVQSALEEQMVGVYVKSIRIGRNSIEDLAKSYFDNVNTQVKTVCLELMADKKLKDGYNAIGFSQGALFLRAVAQRCPIPRMKKLISIGGAHQGVYGFPHCSPTEAMFCDTLRELLTYGAYQKHIQKKVVQAQYWHDPLKEETYKHQNIFLADINNELTINEEYKKNLKSLEKLVLVKFNKNAMVIPRESQWFGFYKPGQEVQVEPLEKTALYTEDRLGLREMKHMGKIDFLSFESEYPKYSDMWPIGDIIEKYLKTSPAEVW